MAATGTKQQQPAAAAAAVPVDPKFEWAEKAGAYVLHLNLQGFRKDDFRVQVDGAGRLTVRGATRPGAGGPGSSLHKVFQLPTGASVDDIAGRFEAGVLTLTIPKRAAASKMAPPTEQVDDAVKKEDVGSEKRVSKRPSSDAAPPTSIDGIRMKPREEGASKPLPRELDSAKKIPAKDDGTEKKEDVTGAEPTESVFSRTKRQVAERVQRMEEQAKRCKQERQKPVTTPKKDKEQELEVNPKAPQAAATAMTPKEKPTPKPISGDEAKVVVDQESLVDRVRRCGEEERTKEDTAAMPMEAKEERENRAIAWKERIAGELKGLKDMKWADNAMEMARKNKEVVAVGIAAFSLGFFASRRLFSK